jgi:hypothetical protein
VRVTFSDPDGVSGTNPQVLGPVKTAASSAVSISGVITDSKGDGLAGVLVRLLGASSDTTRTSASGRYSFIGLPAGGKYQVLPLSPSTSFFPALTTVESLTSDQAISFAAGNSVAQDPNAVTPDVHAGCGYTVAPQNQSITWSGGLTDAVVSTTSRCPWVAVSAVTWITVRSGSTGFGTGETVLSVAVNASTSARIGKVAVAGQWVTITQAGLPACTFTVSPSTASFGSGGGTASFDVTAPSYCAWSSASADSWITIDAGHTGTGSGTVVIAVSPNASTAERAGALVIAGTTVQVAEAGVVVEPPGLGGGGQGNCGATQIGYDLWPTSTFGPGVGPPTVIYTVQFSYDVYNPLNYIPANVYMVVGPVSPLWTLEGNFPITYCYSSAGHYLVPVPTIPPGDTVIGEIAARSAYPNWLPEKIPFFRFISGLPSK